MSCVDAGSTSSSAPIPFQVHRIAGTCVREALIDGLLDGLPAIACHSEHSTTGNPQQAHCIGGKHQRELVPVRAQRAMSL